MLRIDDVRQLACEPVRDERMHRACGVQQTVLELRMVDAGLPDELAKMRLDARSLLQAHEMRDYRHAPIPVIAPARVGR